MSAISLPDARPEELADSVRWPIAGLFLDALTRRDFPALAGCLDPEVRFRALVPPGLLSATGPAETVAYFQRWFGGEDDFEVADASIGQVGSRLYLRWRVRMRAATEPNARRVVEQQVFATARDRITALDLLCSGFHAEPVAPGAATG
jgi:hypothetical protein